MMAGGLDGLGLVVTALKAFQSSLLMFLSNLAETTS